MKLTPWTADTRSNCNEIVIKPGGMDQLLVESFLDAYPTTPPSISIDHDATADARAL